MFVVVLMTLLGSRLLTMYAKQMLRGLVQV